MPALLAWTKIEIWQGMGRVGRAGQACTAWFVRSRRTERRMREGKNLNMFETDHSRGRDPRHFFPEDDGCCFQVDLECGFGDDAGVACGQCPSCETFQSPKPVPRGGEGAGGVWGTPSGRWESRVVTSAEALEAFPLGEEADEEVELAFERTRDWRVGVRTLRKRLGELRDWLEVSCAPCVAADPFWGLGYEGKEQCLRVERRPCMQGALDDDGYE